MIASPGSTKHGLARGDALAVMAAGSDVHPHNFPCDTKVLAMDLQIQAPTLVMIKPAGAHPAAINAHEESIAAIAAIIVHTI